MNRTQPDSQHPRPSYDPIAKGLHWTTVALVLANFALAETWSHFSRATRHEMVVAHMSFGILLAAVVAFRIAWRLMPGHRVAAAVSGLEQVVSTAVHWLLYALLAGQAVLGFVLRWAGGEAMSFFGVPIPSPMTAVSRSEHRLIGELHDWTGWTIIIVALGHAAAALLHHFIARDAVLRRMLPGEPRPPRVSA